jgi:hypothetical protein
LALLAESYEGPFIQEIIGLIDHLEKTPPNGMDRGNICQLIIGFVDATQNDDREKAIHYKLSYAWIFTPLYVLIEQEIEREIVRTHQEPERLLDRNTYRGINHIDIILADVKAVASLEQYQDYFLEKWGIKKPTPKRPRRSAAQVIAFSSGTADGP